MEDLGYRYTWWTPPSGAYFAADYMGQKVLVYPQKDLVIVTRVFTGAPIFASLSKDMRYELKKNVAPLIGTEFRNLVDLILESKPAHQNK